MKKYRVNVNGTVYEVEIEEMDAASAAASANAQAAAPAPAQSAPAAAPAPTATGAGEVITAPMPGNILSVKVHVGDNVVKGQVLMILEAMKMENEIICPRDGVVTSIPAIENAVVDTGMVLITLD